VGLEIESVVAAGELVEQDDAHVAGRGAHDVGEARLGDHQPVARVAHDEPDLLGRRAVVEAEGRRAQEHRGGVDDVELGPVDEHERERVAPAQPEVVQERGGGGQALGQLGVGQRDGVVGSAQGDLVGALGGGREERLAHGGGGEGLGWRGDGRAGGHGR